MADTDSSTGSPWRNPRPREGIRFVGARFGILGANKLLPGSSRGDVPIMLGRGIAVAAACAWCGFDIRVGPSPTGGCARFRPARVTS